MVRKDGNFFCFLLQIGAKDDGQARAPVSTILYIVFLFFLVLLCVLSQHGRHSWDTSWMDVIPFTGGGKQAGAGIISRVSNGNHKWEGKERQYQRVVSLSFFLKQ